ncbi:hypothetical protein SAMN05444358_102130 [Ruegeria halocynthiae]|uniref:Uncharacterized protein n=1 Tax=Ruegeria halocynthiae TaxID=985054 RepID=A0A1H2Y298_9RHOB|nr:hypothetical protein SAMN05444358_102130 [Ruegeria halocynthiae]
MFLVVGLGKHARRGARTLPKRLACFYELFLFASIECGVTIVIVVVPERQPELIFEAFEISLAIFEKGASVVLYPDDYKPCFSKISLSTSSKNLLR